MDRRGFLASSVALAAGWAGQGLAQPLDPARGWFDRWLTSFNGDDVNAYRAFVVAHVPDLVPYVDDDLGLREASGGFEVLRTEITAPHEITAWVKDRRWDRFSRVVLSAPDDSRIADISFMGAPRPADFSVVRQAERAAVADLDARLRLDGAANRFSGAVLVARGDQVVFRKAYGLADVARNLASRTDTRFCMGSMGKMFTAVSILQQAQVGRIALSDPVFAHLPDYPNTAFAKRLTLEQLLTHTGGTGDIFGPFYDAHLAELRTVSDFVRLYGGREPIFEPGSRHGYSNFGFVLLGAILERVTGLTFDAYFDQHIFRPAGMTATGQSPTAPGLTALPYTGSVASGLKPLTPYVGLPAGGGYSTVEDLHAFGTALRGHRLLNPAHMALLTTPRVEAGNSRWSLGLRITPRNGAMSYGHGGSAPGVNGDFAIYPQGGYEVIVLANRGHPWGVNVADYIGARLPA